MAKLADASDLGSDGKPYGFESLRLHHRRRKANSATAPRYRGAVCFYTLRLLFASQKCKTFTHPSFSASPQNCRSFTRFRSAGRLPPRLCKRGVSLPRSNSPPVADALMPQPKSMILPGDPLCRPARRVQIRCRQFAVPSSLLSSLRVPSTAPLRNNTNQNAK